MCFVYTSNIFNGKQTAEMQWHPKPCYIFTKTSVKPILSSGRELVKYKKGIRRFAKNQEKYSMSKALSENSLKLLVMQIKSQLRLQRWIKTWAIHLIGQRNQTKCLPRGDKPVLTPSHVGVFGLSQLGMATQFILFFTADTRKVAETFKDDLWLPTQKQ